MTNFIYIRQVTNKLQTLAKMSADPLIDHHPI